MKDLKYIPRKIETTQIDNLLKLLLSSKLFTKQEVEAIVHALVDISESFEKLYAEIIPNILNSSEFDIDDLKDKIWDVREEFRHIDYHIKDAKLTEL